MLWIPSTFLTWRLAWFQKFSILLLCFYLSTRIFEWLILKCLKPDTSRTYCRTSNLSKQLYLASLLLRGSASDFAWRRELTVCKPIQFIWAVQTGAPYLQLYSNAYPFFWCRSSFHRIQIRRQLSLHWPFLRIWVQAPSENSNQLIWIYTEQTSSIFCSCAGKKCSLNSFQTALSHWHADNLTSHFRHP